MMGPLAVYHLSEKQVIIRADKRILRAVVKAECFNQRERPQEALSGRNDHQDVDRRLGREAGHRRASDVLHRDGHVSDCRDERGPHVLEVGRPLTPVRNDLDLCVRSFTHLDIMTVPPRPRVLGRSSWWVLQTASHVVVSCVLLASLRQAIPPMDDLARQNCSEELRPKRCPAVPRRHLITFRNLIHERTSDPTTP